jgi:hypothetical protein
MVQLREAVFKASELGDQMHGWNMTKKMEGSTLGDVSRNVFVGINWRIRREVARSLAAFMLLNRTVPNRPSRSKGASQC